MRAHLLRLGRQTLIYGLSAVAIQLVGVVTLPVFARVFTPSEYGVLEIVTVGVTAVTIIVDLGLASASQRSYYDYSHEQDAERRGVLFTAILTSVLISLAVTALLIALRSPLANFLFDGQGYTHAVVVGAATLPLLTVATLSREVMRLKFRAWHYLGASVLGAVVSAVASITAVLAFHAGITGALLGGLIGNGVAVLYGVLVVRRDVRGQYSRSELRVMLDYGVPLVPTALALWMLAFLDRLMLVRLADLDQVGQYAIANRLTLVLTLGVTAFATAYVPFLFSMYADDREAERRLRGKTLTYVTIVLAVLAVVLSLYAREGIAVFAPRFDEAYRAVGLLSFGLVAYGISSITLAGITLVRGTRILILYSGAAAALNVGLNFLLIPPWGMIGAAVATAAAYLLLTVLYYRRSQKVYPTPYEPRRLLGVALLATALLGLGAVAIEPLWLSLAVKTLALLAFLVGLRAFGIVDADELARLREPLLKRRAAAGATGL